LFSYIACIFRSSKFAMLYVKIGNLQARFTKGYLAPWLQDATVFATECGFNRVVLEVDCSELVRNWLERESDRSIIKHILDGLAS
jgi:hypothetical protein